MEDGGVGLVNAVLSLGLNFDLWLLWLWAAGRQGRRGEHWHRRLQNASSSGRGVRKGRQRGRIGVDEIEQPDGVSGGEGWGVAGNVVWLVRVDGRQSEWPGFCQFGASWQCWHDLQALLVALGLQCLVL